MKHNNSHRLQIATDTKGHVSPRLGYVFIVLILLQFYGGPFIDSVAGADNDTFWYRHAVSGYSIIVLSIMIFTPKRLELFRDHFSLWAIVMGSLLTATFAGRNAAVCQSILLLLSIVLAIYIIVTRRGIKLPDLKSTLMGLLWSASAVVAIAMIYALFDETYNKSFPSNTVFLLFANFVSQFSYVTVLEEACFRGLLFSFMVMNGFKENSAFLGQALLFWGIHSVDNTNPALFFLIIPLGTLAFTLIAKRYKLLYLSIIMHTFLNVFTTALVTVINRYLF